MAIIPVTQKASEQIRSIRFLEIGKLKKVPAPFLRITTCGLLSIEMVAEIIDSEQPLARYVSFAPDQLRGRGPAPALLLLKLLLSSPKLLLSNPERFASKDWLIQQFCRDRELFSNVRLDNIASQLRSLLCPNIYEGLRTHLLAHVRSSPASGDGYQLAAYPLIWTDIDALAWNVEQGARMERFGDDPLPYWERAYELVKQGVYLPDEAYSDWSSIQREEVAGVLRQCVQALARLYVVRHGEAGEEEALLLLRSYWLEHPEEEDVLRPLMELLGQRECYQEALGYYERLCELFEEKQQPDPRTRDVAEYLRTKQIQRQRPGQSSSPYSSPQMTLAASGSIKIALSSFERDLNASISAGAVTFSQRPGTLFTFLPAAGSRIEQRKPAEDQRHLVGRDEWIQTMQAYLSADLPKKLVIVQAALGAGKSSALHLLRRSLAEQGIYRLFFFTCAVPMHMTAEEHLERFLAELFIFLEISTQQFKDGPATYAQCIRELFTCLAQLEQPVVLFVDNGEVLLQEDGQLATCWQQWFTDLIHYQHQATLFLATREWPGWKGRNRVYVAQDKLPPLSPEAGAVIWQRMGYTGIEETLLQQLSALCGGNPWLIELRASTLLDTFYDKYGQNDGSQTHTLTLLVQKLIQEPHLFGQKADLETRYMLQEVISTRLPPSALLLLDILTCSPLPLPLTLLAEKIPEVEEAFALLQHASLVDRDTMLSLQRARLHPVVMEAARQHRLTMSEQREAIEDSVMQIYTRWREQGIERDLEKAAVTAELIIFELKRAHFLAATELLIQANISLARFGHTPRIARQAFHLLEHPLSRTLYASPQEEYGGILLQGYLTPVLGRKISTEQRAQAYQPIYDAFLQGRVPLQVPTDLYIMQQLVSACRNSLDFLGAQTLLDQVFHRYPDLEQTHPHRYASLLSKQAAFLGAWSDYAREQHEDRRARALREQAITLYRRCIAIWEEVEEHNPPGKQSGSRYNRAWFLNDLAYYLRQQGRFEESLAAIEQDILLESAGYSRPGSLATAYGEKAQILAALGHYLEALRFDRLAVEQIQQEAVVSGNEGLKRDVWMLLAERGHLYLRIGRLKEAQSLFEQAADNLSDDRRSQRILAEVGLTEIQQWRHTSPNEQLDWRWTTRYRALVRYDATQWLTPAAFSPEEAEEWKLLQALEGDEEQRRRMEDLIARSRDREILDALSMGHEPRFHYPRIPFADVTDKLSALHHLAQDIAQHEPNPIVRRLYLDVIEEHTLLLQMVKAAYENDTKTYQHANNAMHSAPTVPEMERAFWHVARLIAQGRQRADLVEVSEEVSQFLQRLKAPLPAPVFSAEPGNVQAEPQIFIENPRMVSVDTIQRFFDAVMRDYGFDGWHTIIDASATVPYIEQLTQCFVLPAQSRSLAGVREMLSHELESHVFRAASGAKSPLDLLSTGTAFFMATEEGVAGYFDRKTAALQGKVVEEFTAGSLAGTLATGLASGVVTAALPFTELCRFFERFFILQRTITGQSKTVEKARTNAAKLARRRCLRTFQGVPDLSVAGIAYTQDALYYRGLQLVTDAIQNDEQVLTRLMVGVVGLQQLGDLAELGITEPLQQPRWLAHAPDLEAYILSFEKADAQNK